MTSGINAGLFSLADLAVVYMEVPVSFVALRYEGSGINTKQELYPYRVIVIGQREYGTRY